MKAPWESAFSFPNPSGRDRHKGALHLAKQIGIKRIAIISPDSPLAGEKAFGIGKRAFEVGIG